MSAADLPARASRRPIVLVTATVLFAAGMLRAPLVAVAPVAGSVGADLGVTAAVVGLLTSIPVLCFAVCAPLAIAVVRRGGVSFALTVALAGAIVGCVIRSAGGLPAALVGTAVLGLFLTIGNIVVPMIIAREYPSSRTSFMTGVYAAAINLGTMAVTVGTAPLAASLGWQAAILVWALFGVVALGTWIALRGIRTAFDPSTSTIPTTEAPDERSILATPSTWLLVAAFAGQAFSYYGVTAWLPTLLENAGYPITQAGAISAIFQVAGVAGALLTSTIAGRAGIRLATVLVGSGWLLLPVGFLISPQLWPIWCSVAGLAQAGGLVVVFVMIAGFGGGERRVAARSGTVQGLGYGVAALGPLTVGALHDVSGSWTVPLLVIVGSTLLFGVAGTFAATRLRAVPA